MRIGVCDEDEEYCLKITHLLENYSKQQLLEMKVVSQERNGYQGFDKKNEVHILFLSVESVSGQRVAVAHDALRKWPGCQIVFLVNEFPPVLELYRVPHLCVVRKDQLERRIEEIMDMAMQKLTFLHRRIVFKIHGKAHLIMAPEEIVFLERDKRITRIVSTQGEYISDEKLGHLTERLPIIDFVRCHNSYIVYFPAVEAYEKNKLRMNNGREIIISRKYEERVKISFERWKRLRPETLC